MYGQICYANDLRTDVVINREHGGQNIGATAGRQPIKVNHTVRVSLVRKEIS
jgi:hypothetical protein